jgi:NAD(P)-dependent dehydrogenase (short-subunit alcohol dehydrogenase family)
VSDKKTAIVTGASQGIGAGLVEAFLKEGYSVVAMSRNLSQSLVTSDMTGSPSLVLVDGDIAKQGTAAKTVDAAIKNFGTVEVLVNNAGISSAPSPLRTSLPTTAIVLFSTNLLGFIYITQLSRGGGVSGPDAHHRHAVAGTGPVLKSEDLSSNAVQRAPHSARARPTGSPAGRSPTA